MTERHLRRGRPDRIAARGFAWSISLKRKISHLCHSVKYIIPGQAAQPAGANETSAAALPAGADDPISFEQYREWRLRLTEPPQTQPTAQLARSAPPPPH